MIIDVYNNPKVLEFVNKFGGDFYTTIPDKIFVYELNNQEYIIKEDFEKLINNSLSENENLFLYLDKITVADNVLI